MCALEECFRRSIAILEKQFGTDAKQLIHPVVYLATVEVLQRRQSTAEPLLLRGLRLAEKYQDSFYQESCLDALSVCYGQLGEYWKVEPLLEREMKSIESAKGVDDVHLSPVLHQLGHMNWLMGQYNQAEQCFFAQCGAREEGLRYVSREQLANAPLPVRLVQSRRAERMIHFGFGARSLNMRRSNCLVITRFAAL